VERVPAPRRRRNHNFDLNTLRRSEIVRHARFVGAMATDDRSRWLIAWVWHNPEPDDQVYSVMLAFAEMNWPLTVLPTLSATQPWRKRGMSRATWYRQNKPGMRRETVLSAITLYSPVDRVVSTERARMEFERGFASKEARGLPSSQTATTMVADSHEALPTELRLLALGLVETDWTKNLARAA